MCPHWPPESGRLLECQVSTKWDFVAELQGCNAGLRFEVLKFMILLVQGFMED